MLTKNDKRLIRRHAKAGAKELDRQMPSWYTYVDLDLINMRDTASDIWHQFPESLDLYTSPNDRASFDETPYGVDGSSEDYAYFTKCYKKQVRKRLSTYAAVTTASRPEINPDEHPLQAVPPAPKEVLKPEGASDPLNDGKSWCLVTCSGTDAGVAQRARTSHATNKPSSTDKSLLRHLMRHRHSSPFEFGEVEMYAKLPISVARQIIRHRTASVSEASARYCELPGDYYVPALDRMAQQSTKNKQGSGDPLTPEVAKQTRNSLAKACEAGLLAYRFQLGQGVARETARGCLSVNTYTVWYFKIDLRNALHFLSLRDDPHTQWETRQYAKVMATAIKEAFPLIYQAYEDYVKEAISLTGPEVRVLRVVNARGWWPTSTERWRNAFEQAGFPDNKRERGECVAKLKVLLNK